jgi:hypothetical protein
MFLYLPDEPRQAAPDKPQFTAEVNADTDNWSFGFDAVQLAALLSVSLDDLFRANRNQALTLEKIEADTETGEGATRKRYTFRLGESAASLVVERLGTSGSA